MLPRLIFLALLSVVPFVCGFKASDAAKYYVTSESWLVRKIGENEDIIHVPENGLFKAEFMIIPKSGNSVLGTFRKNPTFSVTEEPFQIVFDQGKVKDLKVSPEVSRWDIEFIRAVAGQLQISEKASLESDSQFWVMEETVSGNCNTSYNVSMKDSRRFITKTKDYSKCNKLPVFQTGIYGQRNMDVLLKTDNILSRSTNTTIRLLESESSEDDYIIESVKTENVVSLRMKNHTVSAKTRLSIELLYILDDFQLSVPSNLISVGGLSYDEDRQKNFCNSEYQIRNNEIDIPCENGYDLSFKKLDRSYSGNEVEIATKLIQRVAKELQNINDIPKTNTMDRFTILIGIMRNMNLEMLQQTTVLVKENESEWFVFKHAVSEAGTLDALKTMKWFFEMDLMDGNDTDFIMDLPSKCQLVTLEYLQTFFTFAVDAELTEAIDGFETKATIAFSNLLRRYYTENSSVVKRYALTKFTNKKYIRYFEKRISDTLKNNDEMFQVYVRAMGNTGDGHMFQKLIFKRYNTMKPIHKMLMINSMDKIIELDPKFAQRMLLKIWDDEDEDVAIRIAALHQLVKTKLPLSTCLTILYTASDSEEQTLRDAVKKAILSEMFTYRLNENVRALANTIQSSDCFGQPSCNERSRFEFRTASANDSVDQFSALVEAVVAYDEVPSYMSMDMFFNQSGYETKLKVSGMLNNFRNFVNGYSSLSSGNVVFDHDWVQYFYPFENISKSAVMDKLMGILTKEEEMVTKILSLESISIGFPMENGFPFLYTYEEPNYFYLNVSKNFDAMKHPPYNDEQIIINSHIALSHREQMKMSVINPFTRERYTIGNDYNVQVNLPLRFTAKDNLPKKFTLTVQPLVTEGTQRIFHYGNWPYRLTSSLHPVRPVAEEEALDNHVDEEEMKGEVPLDETNRLRFKLRTSEKSDIAGEIQEINSGGPFLNYPPRLSLVNVFFTEDLTAPTSLIISFDTLKEPQYATTHFRNIGNIEGPFMFTGSDFFHMDMLFTGQTNRSLTMSLKALTDLFFSGSSKIEGQVSYYENKEMQAEVCSSFLYKLDQTNEDSVSLMFYSDAKFGANCENGSLVSFEGNHTITTPPSKHINITMDFENVQSQTAEALCELKGEHGDLTRAPTMINILIKDEEKCQPKEKPEIISSEELMAHTDFLKSQSE